MLGGGIGLELIPDDLENRFKKRLNTIEVGFCDISKRADIQGVECIGDGVTLRREALAMFCIGFAT